MQPIRIQKALSEAGVASRRAAEELVRQGRVTINGRKAEIGQSVNPDRDVIAVDGKRVYFARKKQYRYIMMNKPRGYVTTLSDELGRRCVTDLLTGVEERVYPIGRLDRNSEGLLLFTNDGELANRIMHPASHINKVYRVTVRPDITDEQAAELSAGVKIGENTTTLPATVIVLEKQPGRVVLQITISEGKNRQIRRMCEAVGLEVVRLKRIAVGPIKLGMLQPGRWRDLKSSELIALRGAITKAGGNGAGEGTKMLGYVVVEKAEPVRIIALQCEDFVIADGLLRRALHPFYEEGSKGYTFACEVPMPLPMAYTRRGAGSLEALFAGKCPGNTGEI